MNTVNLQISLPEDIYNALSLKNIKSDINEFVIDAIKLKIQDRSESFKDVLKEGYMLNNMEDTQLIADFAMSDMENWD
ncbi:MAG: hypothetical protein V1779_10460 [bacterium]